MAVITETLNLQRHRRFFPVTIAPAALHRLTPKPAVSLSGTGVGWWWGGAEAERKKHSDDALTNPNLSGFHKF